MKKRGDFATTTAVTRLVQYSTNYPWAMFLAFLLLAAVCASYFTRHVAISTDSKKLMSSSLPWRQQEVMLDAAFPERINRILAVIDSDAHRSTPPLTWRSSFDRRRQQVPPAIGRDRS